MKNKDLPKKSLLPSLVPNFMQKVQNYDILDDGIAGSFYIANKDEFKRINELVTDFYKTKDLPNTNWQQLRALKLSLSKSKIIKINTHEDDRLKIKKINNGLGVELQPEVKPKDT